MAGVLRAGPEQDVRSGRAPGRGAPDPETYKDVLGRFCTGLTVVTSLHDEEPVGFTCQAFSALSLDPPEVLISVQRTSTTWPRIRQYGRFGVGVLAAGQDELARALARSGTDKLRDVAWRPSSTGLPRPEGLLAWIECELVREVDAGDHLLAIAAVSTLEAGPATTPLLYFRGDFLATGGAS
ncbi:flavin reductase family protein [Nocardioides sp. LHD-245]|uniref:flavin reductase family protein n=1 Tax=Nocardioides sp. LHD-245 TaxID=3051387 RepID=UPI0027DF223E|nr:flavin reductase family protein [Nocardioides sp. LHD-245]